MRRPLLVPGPVPAVVLLPSAALAVGLVAASMSVAATTPGQAQRLSDDDTQVLAASADQATAPPTAREVELELRSGETARLSARVNPRGLATTVRAEVALTDGSYKTLAKTSAGDGQSSVKLRFEISGVNAAAVSMLRLSATNAKGTITAPVTLKVEDDEGDDTPSTSPAPTTPVGTTPDPGAVQGAVAPVQGETVVLKRGRGKVRFRVPGSSDFSEASVTASIPTGSVVDTTSGEISVASQVGSKTQLGTFSGGEFRVRQVAKTGMTQIVMTAPLDCDTTATAARAGERKATKRKRRHVWGRDRGGRYETHGRDSVATVRGTRWLTTDTCSGTVVKVFEGAVSVRPKRGKGKAVIVRAGGRHFTPRSK